MKQWRSYEISFAIYRSLSPHILHTKMLNGAFNHLGNANCCVCACVCVVAIDFGIRNFARRSIELYWR